MRPGAMTQQILSILEAHAAARSRRPKVCLRSWTRTCGSPARILAFLQPEFSMPASASPDR